MPSKKLGRYLEYHGNRIRVCIRVPPSMVARVGKTQLKETLQTTDPLEAEREKVDVVRRLRASLTGATTLAVTRAVTRSLLTEALEVKRLKELGGLTIPGDAEHLGYDPETTGFEVHIEEVENRPRIRDAAVQRFATVAGGYQTPLSSLLDRWFAEKAGLSVGYREDIHRALSRLAAWCDRTRTSKTVEAITQREAGRYIHEQFVAHGVSSRTANKDLSCLRSYWRWMKRRHGTAVNPWMDQSIAKPNFKTDVATAHKRPFSDDEVLKLLSDIGNDRERDFSLMSALSGLRLEEVAGLRVQDCNDGWLRITDAKTQSGLRTIPAHHGLHDLIASRSLGKVPSAYLFHDLDEQRVGSKRDRSAPVSQAFTRERRRLGVDERSSASQRQSNVDFHSWRRWFIRQAVAGLERGGVGYTMWTIANVVGHKAEDGSLEGVALPLGMTMGRYPGIASRAAMRACVDAVTLPTASGS